MRRDRGRTRVAGNSTSPDDPAPIILDIFDNEIHNT
jgi:hypothetical protein